jgi:hypothetical protein
MIHSVEDADPHITHIPGDQQADHLATAIRLNPVPAREAFYDEVYALRRISFGNQIGARANLAHRGAGFLQGTLFLK